MELVCPAGSLPALKAAVDAGADAVYLGLKNNTNARHFAGLNFNEKQMLDGISYAHSFNRKVLMAINTFAQSPNTDAWYEAVDQAAKLGVDAVIISDIAVLQYAKDNHPHLNRHLSVQTSLTNAAAINWYVKKFDIKRVVLPRVLSAKQVMNLVDKVDAELEVFAFGSLCIMAEGRCLMSSYLTGESPNTVGACSPAKYVRWQESNDGLHVYLNEHLIDHFAEGENAGYPTLCKGRFTSERTIDPSYLFEEPTSLNTASVIEELREAGVKAIKIEGRQRSPAYVKKVTKTWRSVLDRQLSAPQAINELASVAEGQQTTLGAYERDWQ